jgi:hypothetical protein
VRAVVAGVSSGGPRGKPPAAAALDLRATLGCVFARLGRWERVVLFAYARLERQVQAPATTLTRLLDTVHPEAQHAPWQRRTVIELLRGAESRVERDLARRGLLAG